MWKSHLKHSAAEFQSIWHFLAAIGHRFIATTNRKLKMRMRQSEGRHVWRPETRDFFFGGGGDGGSVSGVRIGGASLESVTDLLLGALILYPHVCRIAVYHMWNLCLSTVNKEFPLQVHLLRKTIRSMWHHMCNTCSLSHVGSLFIALKQGYYSSKFHLLPKTIRAHWLPCWVSQRFFSSETTLRRRDSFNTMAPLQISLYSAFLSIAQLLILHIKGSTCACLFSRNSVLDRNWSVYTWDIKTVVK